MTNIEGIFVSVTIGLLVLIGSYAVWLWNPAWTIGSLVISFYLGQYLHRIRICNFCDQKCPFRPRQHIASYTQKGFSFTEKLVFYPGITGVGGLYLTGIFELSYSIGFFVSILLVVSMIIYRRKICPNCHIPCVINPNRDFR